MPSKGEHVTVKEFEGMEPGHPVKVIGHRGKFAFRFAETDGDSILSVCVLGGTAGHSKFRHFRPEIVIPQKVRK